VTRGRWWAGLLLVAAVVHEALLWWLDETNTLAQLFAPGPHLPLAELVIAVLFVVFRLCVFFLGPPILVCWVASELLARLPTRAPEAGRLVRQHAGQETS